MPKYEEWENSLLLMSDKELGGLGTALDTLDRWGMFKLSYPEMRTLRKIIEFEGKRRLTKRLHKICNHMNYKMARKLVGEGSCGCFVTFKRCIDCGAIAPVGTEKWQIPLGGRNGF